MKIVLDTGTEYDLTDEASFNRLRKNIYSIKKTAGNNKTHLDRLLIIYNRVKKYAEYNGKSAKFIRARAIYDLIAHICEAKNKKPSENKIENVIVIEKSASEEIKVNAEKPKVSSGASQTIEVMPANTAQNIPINSIPIPPPTITELPVSVPAVPSVVMPLAPVKFFQTTYQQHLNERNFEKTKYNLQEKEKRLHSYLQRPVTEKKKIGEDNFAESIICMLFDLEKYQSGSDYLPLYLALICGLYMHNASHYPMQGYGKAQALEIDHKLQYFRSESDHPRRIFFDNLVKAVMNEKSVGYLPRNQPFTKILALTSLDKKFANKFTKLNEAGYATTKGKVDNFGPTIGYTGARANNLLAYIYAINKKCVTENSEANIKNIVSLLRRDLMDSSYKIRLTNTLSQKLRNAMPNDVVAQVNFMLKKFQELKVKQPKPMINNNLFSEILTIRMARVKNITENSQKKQWKNLQILKSENTTCIEIRLYPNYKGDLLNSRNFQGLTDTILGFLAGLVNHYAQKRNLFINIQRRQSFGFLRSTLADTDSLTIRVSLGLEGEIFDSILIESLAKLDDILTTFNFITDNHDTVKACKVVCENSQADSGEATEKTGNRLCKSMRSINNKWQAVNDAHTLLNQHSADKQGDYFVSAFNDYLNVVVVNRAINDEKVNVPTLGFSIAMDNAVIQKKPDEAARKNPPTIFKILESLVDYTLAYIAEIEMLDVKNTLHDLKYSYWHALWKLYSNVSKARLVLDGLGKYEVTHLSAKAMLLTENIQEYLILLDGLRYIRDKACGKENTAVEDLRKTQRMYVASRLDVDAEHVKIFYTDSGQQANVASVIAMDMQVYPNHKGKYLSDESVFVFENSYYELGEFFKNIQGLRTRNATTAQIAFIDIRHLAELKLEKFPALQCVIIDITHNSSLTVEELNKLAKQLLAQGKWIVFTSSTLKHEEIGLDKYQSGRIVIISPKEGKLYNNVEEELNAVSNAAMHPSIAAYLNMVDQVYHSSSATLDVNDKARVSAATPAENPVNRTPAQEKTQQVTQVLTGVLHDGTNVSFTRIHNTGFDQQGRAGSCGFIALNTNREAVFTVLTTHLNDPEVRDYLSAEIDNDYEADRTNLHLSHNNILQLQLLKTNLKHSEVYRNQAIAELNRHANIKDPSVNDLIQFFQERSILHKEIYLRRLEESKKLYADAYAQLSTFLKSDLLLSDYINRNLPTEWIGANVALAWAKAANISLRIWTHQNQGTESPEIYLRQSVQGAPDAQSIDILHTWNATHYERITLQPPALLNVPVPTQLLIANQQDKANKENQQPKMLGVGTTKIEVTPLRESKSPNLYAQNAKASMWNTSKSTSPRGVQTLSPILTTSRSFQR